MGEGFAGLPLGLTGIPVIGLSIVVRPLLVRADSTEARPAAPGLFRAIRVERRG